MAPRKPSASAITFGDLLHARLPSFRRRVDETLRDIEAAVSHGRIGVSFSGGKDSTVALDLVRRVAPDASAAWFDSGCDWSQTGDIVTHYGAERIVPVMDFPAMCRYAGWWGYRTPTDPASTFDVGETLLYEPSARWVAARGLSVVTLGLRAEESIGRHWNAKRGTCYWSDQDDRWHCCPLAWWTVADVWAYLADRQLRYHPVYDAMAQMGLPRRQQRIDFLLNENQRAPVPSWAGIVKQIDMPLYNRLAAEFPVWAAWS